jgi:TPR repeat protein
MQQVDRDWAAALAVIRDSFVMGLQMARACQHPDAVWLASLLPRETVTLDRLQKALQEALQERPDDARACFLVWWLGDRKSVVLLERAAVLGNITAVYYLSFFFVQEAAANGDAHSVFRLGEWYRNGTPGVVKDTARAIELYREAAQAGNADAKRAYGLYGYGEVDWERYHWWGLAPATGNTGRLFCAAVLRLLPRFERREHGRVLHAMAPAIQSSILRAMGPGTRSSTSVVGGSLFGYPLNPGSWPRVTRVLELHKAMLDRARRAILCWGAVSRRRGMVKDIRLKIAKMAWEEVWLWG